MVQVHLQLHYKGATVNFSQARPRVIESHLKEKILLLGLASAVLPRMALASVLRQYCHPFSDVSGNTYLLFIKGNIG